ncbi:MAG: serine hydrolase domain-containing protein [Gemmatimonadota bacterium]
MRRLRLALTLLALAAAAPLAAQSPSIDSLDAYIADQMARRQVSGLSLAIVQDGKIVLAKGYGIADRSSHTLVNVNTLFQAGSISKPVAAAGALHLVEQGRLSLDEDVNRSLTSWKVPENGFTAREHVTLRRLLSHTAGMTVHGFAGYDVNGPVPSLVQVLQGSAPTNSEPIRVDTTPGAIWRYSGGGFTVMQQMVVDVTGMPFPEFMQQTVLGPIGMTASSYQQPLPPARAALTAAGYYPDGTPVRGRWHLYPEMAAAGLWTNATDLAKFAIEIQETLGGRGHGVLSQAMARQYISEVKGGYGLGVGISGSGRALTFSHGGRDEGFDALVIATAETGQGIAVMINANENSGMTNRIFNYVARAFNWPEGSHRSDAPAARIGVALSGERLNDVAGYYELRENVMVTLVPNERGTGLVTLTDGMPDEDFLAVDSTHFGSSGRNIRIAFNRNKPGLAYDLTWRAGESDQRIVPRVAPLPSSVRPTPDPAPAMQRRIVESLKAIQEGGARLQDAPVPAGTKRDFTRGFPEITAVDSLTYIGTEDVAGREIRRHESEIASVRMYRLPKKDGRERYLLVHLTKEGQVADADPVGR